MELSPVQISKNSYVEPVKHTYPNKPSKSKTKNGSFNWKKASSSTGKWYKLRRFLAKHIRTFKMGMETLSNKMSNPKIPKSQQWKKEKNTIVFSRHFMRYQREFRKQMIMFIVGAFSFVAALSWNDAIKETLNIIAFNSNFILYKYITAVVVSVICVLTIIFLSESNKY